jgi:hypothetical protein
MYNMTLTLQHTEGRMYHYLNIYSEWEKEAIFDLDRIARKFKNLIKCTKNIMGDAATYICIVIFIIQWRPIKMSVVNSIS